MNWIDQNLDAYRVIAEILTDLRPLVRERIEAEHGKEWFRDGIPEEVFERLIRNKEQEASIDWYENRYQEVISYAVFPDLFEIINANSGLFKPILKLAPSPSLLNTRFLELEVMRSKIGRARQISEAEINFLTSFHLRFRRAVQEMRGEPIDPTHPRPDDSLDAEDDNTPIATPDPTPPDTREQETTGEEEPREEKEPTEEVPEPRVDDEEIKVSEGKTDSGRPPQRLAAPKPADADDEADDGPPVEVDVDDESGAGDESADSDDDGDEDGEPKQRETASAKVNRSMESGDDQTVLREVYREVTGIAEVIWTTDEIPTTAIWDRVSTNTWYESNFSRLELRPLSDFYELISQVRSKRQAGAAKQEIQSFLNDSKFATILLSLRDMFQKIGI